MKIDKSQLNYPTPAFVGEDQDFCGAKPFGGDREHERAVTHNWEMNEEQPDGGEVWCCNCGASAQLRNAVLCGAA